MPRARATAATFAKMARWAGCGRRPARRSGRDARRRLAGARERTWCREGEHRLRTGAQHDGRGTPARPTRSRPQQPVGRYRRGRRLGRWPGLDAGGSGLDALRFLRNRSADGGRYSNGGGCGSLTRRDRPGFTARLENRAPQQGRASCTRATADRRGGAGPSREWTRGPRIREGGKRSERAQAALERRGRGGGGAIRRHDDESGRCTPAGAVKDWSQSRA